MKGSFQAILTQIKTLFASVLHFISAQLSRLKRSPDTKDDLLAENETQVEVSDEKTGIFSKIKSLSKDLNLEEKKEALLQKSASLKDQAKEKLENNQSIVDNIKAKSSNLLDKTSSIIDHTKESIDSKSHMEAKPSFDAAKEKIGDAKQSLQSKINNIKSGDAGDLAKETLDASKEKLINSTSALKDKFKNLKNGDDILSQEALANSKEKLSSAASSIKERINKIKESDSGFVEKLKALPALLMLFAKKAGTQIKAAFQHIKNADVSEIGKAANPFFTKWGQFSLKVASLPWISKMIDKWMSLRLWGKEKIFYRYTMPTLVGVCGIFLIIASLLYLFTYSEIVDLRDSTVDELVESRIQEKIKHYVSHVNERSDEVQQILRDNVNKTKLLANSPTFQELNVQGMEEFSRTLLQQDTNLLNVVVLTHEEVKTNIRTRRIGEETDFIFSCCELNEDRAINYEEIDELSWLALIDSTKQVITETYKNPVNGEQFFYHGSNIGDFKGSQNGAVLLRYNLNFAVRNLQKSDISGVNFLVTNDSLVIASSQDSIFPAIETLSMTDAAAAGPIDYFSKIVEIVKKSKTHDQAIDKITDASFIGDPVKFNRKFGSIMPDEIAAEPDLDTLGVGTWLSVEQAEALLDLSFGQLLKLNSEGAKGSLTPQEMEFITGRELAYAYMDSIKLVENGYILDEDYLLTFATNEFGWTLVNQSTSDEFYSDITEVKQQMLGNFSGLLRSSLWSNILSSLLLILLFSLLITGFMRNFTKPIKDLLDEVQLDPGQVNEISAAMNSGNEMEILGQKFQSMNQEINSYVNQLEKSNLELEQYAHVVSHDLRAPLRTISSFTQLLEQKLNHEAADEKAKSYMSYIQKGAFQMEEMIKGLLSYATLKRKLVAEDFLEVDLNLELQQALDNLKTKIDKVSPEIKINHLPVVRFKGDNVVSVFQNLIDNSIKYKSPEKPLKIDIAAKHVGDNYIVSIEDNGIGIDKDERDKVFDMFYRSGDQVESFGIGLASCKTIIENGGGKIWIDDRTNDEGGALFYISFPNGVKQKEIGHTENVTISELTENQEEDLVQKTANQNIDVETEVGQ